MTIITNTSGTRSIDVTPDHLETIKRYKLFTNLIDSNGIIDESVMEKLRLNVRSLLETGTQDRALLALCFDVIYNPNMKALGLGNLIKEYATYFFEDSHEKENTEE